MIFGLVEFKLDFRIVCLVLSKHSTGHVELMESAEDFELVPIDFFTICQVFGDAHGQKGHDFSQVILDHIPDDSILVIKGDTPCSEMKDRKHTA